MATRQETVEARQKLVSDLPFALREFASSAQDLRQYRGALPRAIQRFSAQFPILSPSIYLSHYCSVPTLSVYQWLVPRVLELTYTAYDLQGFAEDCGYTGEPFRWDEARRFLLRAELDAAYFHLYGIGREDVDYILDTFPIVRRKDEKEHGEYRTKRTILEIYDAMQQAITSGQPYQTRLDPPPAHGRATNRKPKTVDSIKRGSTHRPRTAGRHRKSRKKAAR